MNLQQEQVARFLKALSEPVDLKPCPGTKVISIANQKGGVGKTTTAVNLGAGLAMMGYRTLILDLDIQCNATHVLHRDLTEDEDGMCEILLEERSIDDIIVPTSVRNLHVAPSGESLVHADLNLAGMLGRDSILRSCLNSDKMREYHYILIDTAPYLGLLTINALVASDFVLIPVSTEFLPMLGIRWLLRTIGQVKQKLHPRLEILGYLLTMYDKREGISADVEEILRTQFGSLVFENIVRVNTKHKASPSEHKTIYEYEASSVGRGTQDYWKVTNEFLQRLKAMGWPPEEQQALATPDPQQPAYGSQQG